MTEISGQPDDAIESADEIELKALLQQYWKCFGKEPNWWALFTSGDDDHAQQLREAIRTGQPIELNIPPDCEA